MVPSVIDYLLQLPEAMHFARVQELQQDLLHERVMGGRAKPSSSHSTATTFSIADSTSDSWPSTTREPEKRSTKPNDTAEAFVATSAAMIDASLGVIVMMPSASVPAGRPIFG